MLLAAALAFALRAGVSFEDVFFGYDPEREILHGVDIEIPPGKKVAIVGASGSGKSTLLRLIAGLLEPRSGSIHAAGKAALVFQNPDHQLLLPSCASDLQLGLPADLGGDERRSRVAQSLVQVGLGGFEERPIHTLSGGQKQRLAIAGALASDADLVLLDEPTALLDPDSQCGVLQLLWQLTHRPAAPLTALWITHRLEELQHCDGAALMEHGSVGGWQNGQQLAQRLAPCRVAGPKGRVFGPD